MTVKASIHHGALNGTAPAFKRDGAGAIVRFEGIVRALEDGRMIRGLIYEAYEPMATNMLISIGDQLCRQYGLLALSVEHSQGIVLVGECSFRLQIAGRHRQESLAAMAEFIDRLKADVPIWKSVVETV